MVLAEYTEDVISEDAEAIPADAALIISAIDAAGGGRLERRLTRRISYRTTTELRLFRDEPSAPQRVLYTRDINRRGIGFVTSHRLPLGYGAVVRLPNERGEWVEVHCTLLRCREAAPGWYEGSAYFNREQPQFDR
jgi:hypothetical protein